MVERNMADLDISADVEMSVKLPTIQNGGKVNNSVKVNHSPLSEKLGQGM